MKLGKDESNSGWLRYAMYEFILGDFIHRFCLLFHSLSHLEYPQEKDKPSYRCSSALSELIWDS